MRPRALLAGPVRPFRSGIADQTYRLARALTSLGVAVKVLSFEKLYPGWLYPGEADASEGTVPADCGEIDRCLDGRNPLSFYRAAKSASRWEPDFLVLPWWTVFFAPHVSFFFLGLSETARKRTILYCHNLFDHEGAAWKRRAALSVLKRPAKFIVQNRQLEKELRTLRSEAEVMCLPHPSEPPRYMFERGEARSRLGVAAERKIFLFSGLLREYKGWDVLLEAFRPLASEFPEALLVLAGEPWGAAKELASRGGGPSVRLELRYLPEEERALWFCAADAVVCPYRSATGSGIAADAIGFGKPLLGTRVPGLTEVVSEGESGLLCDPGDVSGLRSVLERFLREHLCMELSQGARRLQATFSPLSHARSVAGFGGVTL